MTGTIKTGGGFNSPTLPLSVLYIQVWLYTVRVSFIGGGNRITQRKPHIHSKSLINFITNEQTWCYNDCWILNCIWYESLDRLFITINIHVYRLNYLYIMMSIMFFASNNFILCLRHLEYFSAYIVIASSNMNIQFIVRLTYFPIN